MSKAANVVTEVVQGALAGAMTGAAAGAVQGAVGTIAEKAPATTTEAISDTQAQNDSTETAESNAATN